MEMKCDGRGPLEHLRHWKYSALAVLLLGGLWLVAPTGALAGKKSFTTPQFALNNMAGTIGLDGAQANGVSVANVAQTLSVSGQGTGTYLHFRGLALVFWGTPSPPTEVRVKQGTTVITQFKFSSNAPFALTAIDVRLPENTALSLEVDAGGSGVVSYANLYYAIEDTTQSVP